MSTYSEKDLKELSAIEGIQQRPGMYVGSNGDAALSVVLREIVDNAMDEAINGFGKAIDITVDTKEELVQVRDYARGIPSKAGWLARVCTMAHSGGKFASTDGGKTSYKVSGGLHGIGLKAANALSSELTVESARKEDGVVYTADFCFGKLQGKVAEEPIKKRSSGTTVTYRLSNKYLKDITRTTPTEEEIVKLARERAYFNNGLQFNINYDGKATVIKETGGIKKFVQDLQKETGKENLFKDEVIYLQTAPTEAIQIEIAFLFDTASTEEIYGYTNCIYQPAGGKHVNGLRMSLPRVLAKLIADTKFLTLKDKETKFASDDYFEGIYCVISVKHEDPVFEGQTKGALANNDVLGAMMKLVGSGLPALLEKNKALAKIICQKVLASAQSRIAASKSKEASKAKSTGMMKRFGKLADCISKDITINELICCEGDSAGGSCKQGRDNKTQAVYPLKGKPLNVHDRLISKCYDNVEIADLASVIGIGLLEEKLTEVELSKRLSKLRYGKIIIAADSDDDGAHINCLLLTLFFKYFKPLIEQGNIFVAQPPLYKLNEKGKIIFIKDNIEFGKFVKKRIGELKLAVTNKAKAPMEIPIVLLENINTIADEFKRQSSLLDLSQESLDLLLMSLIHNGGAEKVKLEQIVLSYMKSAGYTGIESKQFAEGEYLISGVDLEERFVAIKVAEEMKEELLASLTKIFEPFSEKAADKCIGFLTDAYAMSYGTRASSLSLFRLISFVNHELKRNLSVSRLKGLGEMDAQDLGLTTLNKETRTLIKIKVSDYNAAGEFIRDMMSDSTIDKRKELVRKYQALSD